MLETALEYIRRGFQVIPLRGKQPHPSCGMWGKVWAEERDVRLWFTAAKVTGIGLRLFNLVAIDIDTYKGEKEGDLLETAGAIISGRGVTGLWSTPPDTVVGTGIGDSEVKRGGNAYVAVPPSIHPVTNKPYVWKKGSGPWDAVKIPTELLRRIMHRSANVNARHYKLLKEAVRLRKEGKIHREILAGLRAFNEQLEMPLPAERLAAGELENLASWAEQKVGNFKVSAAILRKEFIKMYNGRLLRVIDPHNECWRAWTGRCWEEYSESSFRALVLNCADIICAAAREEWRPYHSDSLARWASGETQLHTREKDFDRDPELLNCKNATWSPRGIYTHRAKDRITKCTDVNYIRQRIDQLDASEWGQFLKQTFAGEDMEEMLEYVQKAVGYSILGDNRKQLIFFIKGSTATGKSTFLQAIRETLGSYAAVVRADVLLRHQYQRQNTPEIAELKGIRLAISSEVPQGETNRLDEQLLKSLTGDRRIKAMAKYKAPEEFRFETTIWIALNKFPAFDYEDKAVERRVRVIPFSNSVPEDKQRPELNDIFASDEWEREIILAWILEGTKKFLADDQLTPPARAQIATREYFASQDPFNKWFDENVVEKAGVTQAASEFYDSYCVYCRANYSEPVSKTKFGMKLGKKIGKAKLICGVRKYSGWSVLKLTSNDRF